MAQLANQPIQANFHLIRTDSGIDSNQPILAGGGEVAMGHREGGGWGWAGLGDNGGRGWDSEGGDKGLGEGGDRVGWGARVDDGAAGLRGRFRGSGAGREARRGGDLVTGRRQGETGGDRATRVVMGLWAGVIGVGGGENRE